MKGQRKTMEMITSGKCMTFFLTGEIDHHNAASIRKVIDEETDKLLPQVLVLDFSGVTFMDSSGVGLVMGRYRNVSAHGGRLEAVNLPPWCYKIMKMSGLEKIARIRMMGGKQ
ncbi:MAG: anti-sigma factor antagonist [Acutalibacteraceae bacterium]|nr:anti-sigma factor antagonist [Acutalibacteraceae bacterium]